MLQTADAAVILMTDLAENVDAITGETTVVCGSSSFSAAAEAGEITTVDAVVDAEMAVDAAETDYSVVETAVVSG